MTYHSGLAGVHGWCCGTPAFPVVIRDFLCRNIPNLANDVESPQKLSYNSFCKNMCLLYHREAVKQDDQRPIHTEDH